MKRISLTSRFLKLTLAGYFFSIFSVAMAVWIASAPALQELSQNAKSQHLQTKAVVVARVIDDLVEQGVSVARQPDVVAFAAGGAFQRQQARRAISHIEGAISTRIIDASGRTLLSASNDFPSSRFMPVEALQGLAAMIERRSLGRTNVSYRPGIGEFDAQFLVTVPIIAAGEIIGLLAFVKNVDLTHILSAHEGAPRTYIATSFQIENWAEWYGGDDITASMNLPGADFFLIVDSDHRLLQNTGLRLVQTSIFVSLLALVLPFSVMAFSGMRAIVKPHQQLERSQQVLAMKQREAAELAQIAQMANECIIVTDVDQTVLWVNDAFTKTSGYSREEVLGKKPHVLLHGPETDVATQNRIAEAIGKSLPIQVEIINYRKDGSKYWINLGISPLEANKSAQSRFVSISTDITNAKETQNKLAQAKAETEQQAFHDSLTELPNRRYLDNVLETEVTDTDAPRALIRVDLDHFKNVNDTLGHAAGDYVLQQVAQLLKQTIDANDIAVRIGGDEFVILLGQNRGLEIASLMADTLSLSIQREMRFEGNICRVGASFGVASASDGLINNTDLLKSADSALYAAKDLGRNKSVIYTPQLHGVVNEKRKLSTEIEKGIANGEFQPFFQPQFDARSKALVGIEALVRWMHPTRGMLLPSQFLRVAEQLRLNTEIDREVLHFGLAKTEEMTEMGMFIPKISFNMDVFQIVNTRIEDMVAHYSIGQTCVALEVLESVLVEEQDHMFIDRIESLRARGFQIEVDDFGSGHASVIGLRHLNPDIMKLDRMLVQPVDTDATARALVRNMIEMGKALGISVTAEGVETAEHAAIMTELGCDTLQGYYFARPMPFEDLKIFVQQHTLEAPKAPKAAQI